MEKKPSSFVLRFLTFSLLFLSINAWAQLDKIHYIPPFFAPDSVGNVFRDVGEQSIVLTTQETVPFDVSVYRGNTLWGKHTISQSSPALILLGSGFDTPSNPTGVVNESGMNVPLTDQGFMLEAEHPFFSAIYQRSGAQGDVLTCKGETALGNEFYSGHLHSYLSNLSRKSHFLTVMATFDNTQITFSNPRVRWQGQGANTFTVTLNKNESYALGASFSYIDKAGYDVNDYNGTKVMSTKPIAVNSGSWCGSANAGNSQDIGIDQLVPQSFVGQDYVVVEGYGTERGEKVIVTATRPNTELYVNDTLEHTFAQAGEYYTIDQDEYSAANNLALHGSKKIYVFQTLSGRSSDVAVGLCFIPPLSCLSNREVNVSYANKIGDPMLNIITEVGANVTINGLAVAEPPQVVVGNPDWVTYRLDNAAVLNYDSDAEDFEIVSSHAINAALAFQDGAIGGAGFFSGFGVSPQMLAVPNMIGTEACYPNNAILNASGYDSYIWYYNNEIVEGENASTLVPSMTGQYRVSGFTACGVTKASDPFILKTCLTLVGGGDIVEGDAPKPVYVYLGLPAAEDVEYWYRIVPTTATEGHDYKALTGIGIIEAGEVSDSLMIEVLDDNIFEGGAESFQFEVYYASNATVQNSTLDYQIIDNEGKPTVQIPSMAIVQEDAGRCELRIDHNFTSEVSASFDYSTYDLDSPSGDGRYYSAVTGTYTIAPGQRYGYISIPIIDNEELNPSRVFYLKLVSDDHVNLSYDEVKVTIQDDDSPSACLSLSLDKTEYDESQGDFEVTVLLDHVLEVDVSCKLMLEYSSTSAEDFALSPMDGQELKFSVGDTLKTLHFTILDDALVEPDEVLKLTLIDGVNANICTGTSSITIVNNDYIPHLLDDNFHCLEDKSLTANVSANDVVLGDTPVFVDFTRPLTGVFWGDSSGQFFYQPEENFSGAVFFTYGVRDRSGDSLSAQVQVIVEQVNDVPIAYNDTVYTDEDVPVRIYPLLNDQDVDRTGLSIESVDDNDLGTVDIQSQYVDYSPYANENGTDVLSYAMQDNEGDPAYAKIVVRVRAVNDVPLAHADVFRMNEDGGAKVLDVLLNDEDQDRSGLTLKSISEVVGGQALLIDNRVTFTPAPNFWGQASFEYTMYDGEGDSAVASVTIEVLGANDWPLAVDDAFTVDEDAVLTMLFLSNDIDDDQRGLSVVRVDSASHGRIYTDHTQWFYQPQANYNGQDAFRYFIEDWNNDGSNAWVNITVNSINERPIAQPDTFSVLEDEDLQFLPIENDEDPDHSMLSFVEILDLAHGVISESNRVFSYQPEHNYYGDNSFDYVIADGEGDLDTATVVLSIIAVNEKPQAENDFVLLDEDQSVDIPLLSNDYDPDGGGLWVDTIISRSSASLWWRHDTLVYTPRADVCGLDTLYYVLSDAQGDKDNASIYIDVRCVNEAPLAYDDTVVATEDVQTVFFPLMNDEDPDGGGLEVVQMTSPSHGTVELKEGVYYYTSHSNYSGSDSFSYHISDAENDKDSAKVLVTVLANNDYPIATDDRLHVDEDMTLPIRPLANDSDVEDTLPVRLILHQEPSLGDYELSSTEITYHPFLNRWGYDTLSYVAMDSDGAISDVAYIYIVIDSVNERPVVANAAVVLNEDGKDTTDVLLSAQDPDFSGLRLVAVEAGNFGDAFIFEQQIVYHPQQNYHGKDTVTFTIVDGEGDEALGSVIYTIMSVNDAPVAYHDEVSTLEDISILIKPLDNDVDIEDRRLTSLFLLEKPQNGVGLQQGAALIYTPKQNWWGVDTLSYITKDTDGASSDVAWVYIRVDSVNEAPRVGDVFVNVSEDVLDTIDVLTYAQSPDHSPLSLVYPELPIGTTLGLPSHGMSSIEDNKILYQSFLNYYGPDTLFYSVEDGEGDISSASLFINVLSVNDAPVANPDSFRFVQGIGAEDKFTLLALTRNDTDVDEHPIQGRVLIDTLPLHGTIQYTLDEVSLIYYPDSGFTGYDSLCYRVQDTLSAVSEPAWAIVETDSFNFVPRAVDDTIWLWEDDSVTFDPIANDWDVHNDSLWPTVAQLWPSAGLYDITATPAGRVYLKNDHAWTYKPERDFYGRDSFYYFANDSKGGITRAKVMINVHPVNDAPVLDMKYRNLLYPENAGWREVLYSPKIADIDDTMMRGASLTVSGETMKNCQLMVGESDLQDQIVYDARSMRIIFKDSLMSIASWELVLNSIRYRNDSDNDSTLRAFSLVVYDSEALVSDTLRWMMNIQPSNDVPQLIMSPLMSGRVLPDSVLTCTSGQWQDPDGEILYAYQWQAILLDGTPTIYDDSTSQLLIRPAMLETQAIWCEVLAYNATEPPVYAPAAASNRLEPENHYPQALHLLSDTIFRTDLPGTFVGVLRGDDVDSLQVLDYQLLSARDSFYLVEDSLFLAISAYELDTRVVSISVRVRDNGDVSLFKDFILHVYPYNDLIPEMLQGFPQVVGLGGDTVAVSILADKPGMAYYSVFTASDVLAGRVDSSLVWSPHKAAFDANASLTLTFSGLASESDYYFAVQLVDTSLRYASDSYFIPFRTLDVTGPQYVKILPSHRAIDGVMLHLALSEPADLFYRCRENDTTYTVDSSYIDTAMVDSAVMKYTVSRLENSLVFTQLKSQMRYDLYLSAVDTLGNVTDTLYTFTTLDTIIPHFQQDFPRLLDFSESRIRYQVQATEQARLMVRLASNYDGVDSFLTDYEIDLFADENTVQENVVETLRSTEMALDGIYHLDFMMVDTAGNRSPIHSLDFQYPEPFIVILKKECIGYNEDVELEKLTEAADYYLYNISGEIIQTGRVKPDHLTIDIPTLHEGVYIIRFLNEWGDYSFQILQRGKF